MSTHLEILLSVDNLQTHLSNPASRPGRRYDRVEGPVGFCCSSDSSVGGSARELR
jgi:hypothetical protein